MRITEPSLTLSTALAFAADIIWFARWNGAMRTSITGAIVSRSGEMVNAASRGKRAPRVCHQRRVGLSQLRAGRRPARRAGLSKGINITTIMLRPVIDKTFKEPQKSAKTNPSKRPNGW